MKTYRWSMRAAGMIAFSRAMSGSALAAATSVQLAQIPSNLRTGLQAGLGVLFLFGFIWGVITIWGGAHKLKNGDPEGKMGIVSGIVIAAAAAIMEALFAIFGMSDGSITPTF